uniref:Metalloendopeptidase n=1 Tax=Panagrellus redivivus TaxID=6233 RepID=A0A7E4UM05_PANRE
MLRFAVVVVFVFCLSGVQAQDLFKLFAPLIAPPPPRAADAPKKGPSPASTDAFANIFRLGESLAQTLQKQNTAKPTPIPKKVTPSPSFVFDMPSPTPPPPLRPTLIPLADEPLLKIFKPRDPGAQRAPGIGGGSRAGTPLLRITENFGKNFFSMLDELHEYTGPQARVPITGVSGQTATGVSGIETNSIASDSPTTANTPADFLSAHNLMSAFLKATARRPGDELRPLPVIHDGTEQGQNRPVMNQLFESDILLTSKQAKAIVLAEVDRKNGGRRRAKRKVITGAVYRWPQGRPIPFGWGHFDKEWRQIIRRGLIKWEKETCLRFQEDGHGKDRLEFFQGSGCYSSVGKVGGKQKVSIGRGCEDEGIVSHEVGHALGFWHEQSRPDRGKYIRLEEKYIAGGTEGNFAKRSDLEADGMGLQYDMGSVMHYGPQAFTTDWDKTTIVTLDKKYQHTIGQRSGPSFIDVKQINRLYCNDICKGSPLVCLHDGYPDPNNCLVCKCPVGFGGPRCGKVEASECGGELTALVDNWQHLTHTGKDRCVWRVKAHGARIRFIVDTVQYKCDTTCRSFVEIKHNSDFQQIGFRNCCEEKDLEVLSDQDEIVIIHDATGLSSSKKGTFAVRYIADSGTPLPKPPPPVWIPGRENRPFRGVAGSGQVIEKFILNALPKVRDVNRPAETTFSILTDYFASSLLGASRDNRKR